MQHNLGHGSYSEYNPPDEVKKEIVKHAVRHMPFKHKILKHCYPSQGSYHQGLKPHKHNDGGTLQWAFQN